MIAKAKPGNQKNKKIIGVFVFDGPMYCDVNGTYCNTTVTEEMLSRYLYVADMLLVVIRTYHISETYEQAKLKKIDNPNFRFVELPNIVSPKGMLQRKKTKESLRKYVKRADLFFLRMPSISSNLIADLCMEEKKPYMVEVGGCAWDSYWNHDLLGKLIAPYMFMQEKKTVRNAAYASYVTERWLQQRYPCNCDSISASNVYLPETSDCILEERLRKISSYRKNQTYTIGTTAAVNVRYKGQEYVIKAIGKLKQNGIRVNYELVGSGDHNYLTSVARKCGVEDQVIFKGVMLHEDVIRWLDRIDFYVQPSKQEGLPRGLIEAMSRGLPCMGSTTAGIPELLDPPYIFENGDVKNIVKILEKMCSGKQENCAKRNFNKSREYEIGILNDRRNSYYIKYRDDRIKSQYEKNFITYSGIKCRRSRAGDGYPC